MIAPLKLISGNDHVVIEEAGRSVFVDIQPWRDQGAAAYLDFSDALRLLEWLAEWLAENAPPAPEA